MLGYKGAGEYGYREGRWVWLQGGQVGMATGRAGGYGYREGR